MTILAAFVEPERALVWTDGEFFTEGRPASYGPKLAINSLAQVAVVSTGSTALLRVADEAALRGTTFDEIVPAVRSALRSRVHQVSMNLTRRDPSWLSSQAVVVVGWSASAGRVLGAVLHGSSFFEPVLAARMMIPELPGDAPGAPSSIPELIAVARGQMEILREKFPEARGGTLQIAELTASRITIFVAPDFSIR